MQARAYSFCVGVVGEDGAKALAKAASSHPLLAAAILPRVVYEWLGLGLQEYEGELPGVSNSYLSLSKAEDGTLSGCLGMGAENYSFNGVPREHVVAAIAVSLGADADHVDPALARRDLVGLGRSIGLLAKSRFVSQAILAKVEAKRVLARAEPPGQPAPPQAQMGPTPAAAPELQPRAQGTAKGTAKGTEKNGAAPPVSAKAGALPSAAGIRPGPQGKTPSLKLPLRSSERPCSVCGERLFRGEDFCGCVCFSDLAKSVVTVRDGDSVILNFGRGWDADSISVLLQTLTGRRTL